MPFRIFNKIFNTYFTGSTNLYFSYYLSFQNPGRAVPQKDTDSSCSNDSGRGLSEEGENSVMGGHQSPKIYGQPGHSQSFNIAASPASKQPHQLYPPCPPHLKSKPSALNGLKPALPTPDYESSRQFAVSYNQHQQPLDAGSLRSVGRQSGYKFDSAPAIPRRVANVYDNHGYHKQPLREPMYANHEEFYGDTASTTSGSYFVNLHDFDDDTAPRSVAV